jgi:hypothetical protein
LFFDDGDQHVDRDGDPDLRLHCILGGSVEAFDTKVLFDPLEKEFNLPSAFVEGANGERRKRFLVGQEHQRLARFWIVEADTTQMIEVMPLRVIAIEGDGLVANQAGRSVGTE